MKWILPWAALGLSGCALAGAAAAASTLAPLGLSAVEAIGLGSGIALSGNNTETLKDPDESERCEQLQESPPWVAEVRIEKDGTIALRQWALAEQNGSIRWAVIPSTGSDAKGWRVESEIAAFDFNPPLTQALAKEGGDFLVSTPARPENSAETEMDVTAVAEFGSAAGSYNWRGKRYMFEIAKELPCFPYKR